MSGEAVSCSLQHLSAGMMEVFAINPASHASVAMQDAWQVLHDWQGDAAGQPETAVVAALSFWDYSLVANVPGSDTYKATGRCFSVAAGRISYSYGLKGPNASSFLCLPYHIITHVG